MRANLLRTLTLSIVFCLVSLVSRAQFVPIPDPGFVTWLNANGYAACMNGNLMDTTCPAVVNAVTVNCSNSYVRDITGITYFDSLQYLSCNYDSLSFIPTLPVSLTYLACDANQISSLPDLPSGLIQLFCSGNPNLNALPTLPTSLKSLYCFSDSLTTLPVLPNSIIQINCSSNHLASLPSLPTSLISLDCSNNQILALPPLPQGLRSLKCANNTFTSGMPVLPNTLKLLWCGDNLLTVLPSLPASLEELDCSSNQIGNLPIMPSGLKSLKISDNPIIGFPLLPDSLIKLYCNYIQTTSLPVLPSHLQLLYCSGNPISTLPNLPNSLTELIANYCNLTSIPELPDSMVICDINVNANLFCLPRFKRIVYLDFTNTAVTCLPNYGYVTQSNPALNTLPLCDANNANGCSPYWNVSGRTYLDADSNCVVNGADVAQQNVKVLLHSDGNLVGQAFGNVDGFFSFDNDSLGTYEVSVDTSNIPFYVLCPVNNLFIDTLSLVDSFNYNNDFALRCKPGFDLAAHSVYGFPFRQANFTSVQILAGDLSNFYGAHCAAGVSGTVTVNITGPAKYIAPLGGALTPSTVSGNLLNYNIADFGNVNFFTDFGIMVRCDTTAQIGDAVCFEVVASPFVGDNNQGNNSKKMCFSVIGSLDPNEKEVYPAGNTDTATKWLTYTIHFQNTGNAEAQNIHVDDTLDVNLDASTLELLAYSFQPKLSIKDRAVRFNFIGINLPDSTSNEPASKGYVQYRIKLKDNLPLGTHISNTAFIYFDFNPAVVTNTTSNTISTTVTGVTDFGFRNADFGLSPNPANNSVTVSMDESMIGSNLTITDVTGKEVLHSAVQIRNLKFAIQNFSPGVYFVTLENKYGKTTKKLVKQ